MSTQPQPASTNRKMLFGLSSVGLIGLGACLCLAVVLVVGGLYLLPRQPAEPQPAVAYVLDASPRMELPAQGEAGGTRLENAQAVLAEAIRPAAPGLNSGLRVFGSGANSDSCADTELVVPFAPANQTQIIDGLSSLTPGSAPDAALGEAMLAAVRDLSEYNGPHWLVVVTGGVDSCDGQTGQLIAQVAERAGVELQTFVVGYQVDEAEFEAIKTYIDDIPNGEFLAAPNADTLRAILDAIREYIASPSEILAQAIALAATPTTPPPTATPVFTPTPEGYQAQSACDHPYNPLRLGAVWSYVAPDLATTNTLTAVTGDLENASATTASERAGGGATTTTNDCSPDGIGPVEVVNFDEAGNLTSTTVYSYESGRPIAPPDQWEAGATWSTVFTITLTSSDGTTRALTITSAYTVVGEETVSVAAGEFTALRLEVSTTSVASNGNQSTANLTSWYAYGVGLVRAIRIDGSLFELVNYDIPE